MSDANMSDDKDLDSLVEMMTAAGPSNTSRKQFGVEEFQKMLDETPLFMRETPKDGTDNPVLEGLRSLIFEGEGDEIALNFKNHGNEHHQAKQYKEAIKAYAEGLEAGPVDFDLRISLLNNRAACNLALKNYGQVLKDIGVIIALCTKEGKEVPIKGLYRAAKSLIALERWKEAKDVVERGKEVVDDKGRRDWEVLDDDIGKGLKRITERRERLRRERISKEALKAAVESRGLMIANAPSPPENPHPLSFDPQYLSPEIPLDNENDWIPPSKDTPLIFPTFLLYPTYAQSDLITHFQEETSLEDQLSVMFPNSSSSNNIPFPEWDTKREYFTGNLVVYVETASRRLLKVGKELTLREVLRKAYREPKDGVPRDGVVLKDGLLSFVVLVKGTQEKAWIEEFKRKRDGK